jgi:hypothetical protein
MFWLSQFLWLWVPSSDYSFITIPKIFNWNYYYVLKLSQKYYFTFVYISCWDSERSTPPSIPIWYISHHFHRYRYSTQQHSTHALLTHQSSVRLYLAIHTFSFQCGFHKSFYKASTVNDLSHTSIGHLTCILKEYTNLRLNFKYFRFNINFSQRISQNIAQIFRYLHDLLILCLSIDYVLPIWILPPHPRTVNCIFRVISQRSRHSQHFLSYFTQFCTLCFYQILLIFHCFMFCSVFIKKIKNI